jgi:hypothetical protein
MNSLEELVNDMLLKNPKTSDKAKFLLYIAVLSQAVEEGKLDKQTLKTIIDFI